MHAYQDILLFWMIMIELEYYVVIFPSKCRKRVTTMNISNRKKIFLFFILDIEECATEIDNCNLDANCTNTKGSFNCTCHTGYSGDGVMCNGTVTF